MFMKLTELMQLFGKINFIKENIKKSLGIYQTELRKPIHTVFCLDYSGSMYGEGIRQLTEAMEYILNEENPPASKIVSATSSKVWMKYHHQMYH